MKVLDRYILHSYLIKFLTFFVIIMVVFIFQTIWMFIDDLAGKELDAEILFKFIIFYCPKLIPLVLPLTVLLASIMTFGDLADSIFYDPAIMIGGQAGIAGHLKIGDRVQVQAKTGVLKNLDSRFLFYC